MTAKQEETLYKKELSLLKYAASVFPENKDFGPNSKIVAQFQRGMISFVEAMKFFYFVANQ